MKKDNYFINESNKRPYSGNRKSNVREERVNVILVRHGEREDEANGYKKRKIVVSKKDAVDPHLTHNGFHQAQGAFESIYRYYNEQASLLQEEEMTQDCHGSDKVSQNKKRKVFVFSSPLRRTIGTALMSCHLFNENVSGQSNIIESGLPLIQTFGQQPGTQKTNSNQVEKEKNRRKANIVVMDGLCDCASAIIKCGGAPNAISSGYVDCAARVSQGEDYNGEESLIESLQDIISIANPSERFSEHNKDIPANYIPICLWREKKYYDTYPHDQPEKDHFETMTCKFNMNGDGILSPQNSVSNEGKRIRYETPPRKQPAVHINNSQKHGSTCSNEDTFLGAINRAAYFTAKAGCTDCIIVTHREGLRYLAKHVCGFGHFGRGPNPKRYRHPSNAEYEKQLKTPYCAIGSFVANVKFNTSRSANSPSKVRPFYSVKWTFHGIVPYQEFPSLMMRGTLQQSICNGPVSSDLNNPTHIVTVTTKGEKIKDLCDVDITSFMRLQNQNPEQCSIKCIHIYGVKNYDDLDKTKLECAELHKIPIKDGSRSLLHYFGFLNKELLLAEGFIQYSIIDCTGNNETMHSIPFVLNVLDQTKIPCPPSHLYIKVLKEPETIDMNMS